MAKRLDATARMIKKMRTPSPRRLYVRTYRMDFTEKKTEGGIILPQNAYEREIETGVRALILKVGKACDPDLQPNMWVLIPRFAGTRIDTNGDYILISEDSVICMLDEEETLKEIADAGDPEQAKSSVPDSPFRQSVAP